MNPTPPPASHAAHYELHFVNLFNRGRGYAFPCDAEGHVALADLSERGRLHYAFASAATSRDFSTPTIAVAI